MRDKIVVASTVLVVLRAIADRANAGRVVPVWCCDCTVRDVPDARTGVVDVRDIVAVRVMDGRVATVDVARADTDFLVDSGAWGRVIAVLSRDDTVRSRTFLGVCCVVTTRDTVAVFCEAFVSEMFFLRVADTVAGAFVRVVARAMLSCVSSAAA